MRVRVSCPASRAAGSRGCASVAAMFASWCTMAVLSHVSKMRRLRIRTFSNPHVNIGFFHGDALSDPARLLQGEGKFMRHVKLATGAAENEQALEALIAAAYLDIKARLKVAPAMTQPPEELDQITATTLDHYNGRAAEFWSGTRDHDVKQNIHALLRHIRGTAPFHILDFGCGPGRDLAALRALGHVPIGLEGSHSFAAMARDHSGCEVWEQNFLALALPAARFDGIFANASLFHVPRQELPRVLGELRAALRPRGCPVHLESARQQR